MTRIVAAITAALANVHIPRVIVGLLARVVGQVSINLAPGWLMIAGNPVDLTTPAGRWALLLTLYGLAAKLVQTRNAPPATPAP